MYITCKSKNIDDNEITAPKIINGFDFSFSFFARYFLDKDLFLSLSLFIRFEKDLFTLKNKFNKLLIHCFK